MNLFDTEGMLYKIGTVLADIFLLSFLWIIFSLPLITIGASTTAIYYVCTKKTSGRTDAYVLKGFWKSFKENFVGSTVIFLILTLIGWVLWINFHARTQVDLGFLNFPITIALSFVLIQLIFIAMYVFPILSRFEVSGIRAIRTALHLSNRHLLLTIANGILFAAVCILTIWIPFLFIFIPGIFAYLSSINFVKIFLKHKPDFL